MTLGSTVAGPLDPADASGAALMLLRTACDGLVALDHSTGVPKPALASAWQIGEDGKSIAMTLLKNMKFHDGTGVDSRTLAANLSRVARPVTQSKWAWLLAPIEGFAEVQSGAVPELSGLKAVAEDKLEITLTVPRADFVSMLAHPGLIPISGSELSKDPEAPAAPVCAGPYRIEASEGAETVRLIQDDSYRGENRGFLSPQVRAEEIAVRQFETEDEAFEAYRRGEIDASIVPVARALEVPAEEGIRRTTSEATYLAFDPARPETSHPKLRQAISLSVDRRAIIDAAYGDGRSALIRWLGPESADLDSTCADFARQRTSDPERARTLLAESGVPPELRLPLRFDASIIGRLVAQSISVQIKDAIGVELELQPLDPPAFTQSLRDRGDPAVWIVTSGSDIPLTTLLFESLFLAGGRNNTFGFKNEEVEALLVRAHETLDEDERFGFYERAEDVVCGEASLLPLWTGVRHWVVSLERVAFEGEPRVDVFGDLLLRHSHSLQPSATANPR